MVSESGQPVSATSHEITDMLIAVSEGSGDMDRLMAAVYGDLKEIAHGRLLKERADHTLGTTDLVHESYFRLVDQERTDWQNRAHFFRVAAMMMRRVLVDHARRHRGPRRGGDRRPVSLEAVELSVDQQADLIIGIDNALSRLAALSTRLVRVVECRWFAGLTAAETAEALGVSERTVRREWKKARALLREALATG